MKRNILTLLCVTISLCVMATTPRLSRAQLKSAQVTYDRIDKSSPVADSESSASLQQFLRERRTAGNRLNSSSLQSESFKASLGSRIASADLYDFIWADSIAHVRNAPSASIGGYCYFSFKASSQSYYLNNFYGDFEIPIEINASMGAVTIKAGMVLAVMTDNPNQPEPTKMNASNALTDTPSHTWILYAMPLSWLTGDDDYDDIHGQMEEDGSVTFSDDFAFLVETRSQGETSWGLSPIFKNLTLLMPNGRHQFTYTRKSDDELYIPIGMGYGGLLPRKPGQNRPVTPRPIAPSNGTVNQYCDVNPSIQSGGSDFSGVFDPTFTTTNEDVPVYMYKSSETTLMVYNLFGLGDRCRIRISKETGTINIRYQEVYNNGLDSTLYIKASDGTWAQDTVMWDSTLVDNKNHYSWYRVFKSNRLFYSDGTPLFEVLEPVFDEPVVTDSTVVFNAMTTSPDGVTALYWYFEEDDCFCEVENPFAAPRLEEPYWICLAAQTLDTITMHYSEPVWLNYEVPALEVSLVPGDVNGDGNINITDVSLLINALMQEDYDLLANRANADVNQDGEISITDVVALINHLISSE